ncbi:MAG: folylpolyglutamate synthase/dihydrofolate synthase family protein [Cyanobacteriota bacterium]|nr:folylpolyglutamate synthase/dihydrofolate synthase family protein [Cyanobacteriota bacterium]
MTQSNIDAILKPFQRFGVHLGLKRIKHLLERLGNPHTKVPIAHVAGSNGKGSVCTYVSSVLATAGYRVGRYTSPHLVDWTERICINNKPISENALEEVLLQVQNAVDPGEESPTQFEIITAAAWLYFARGNVDIAVIEVGLGGRLDATNVCDTPLVTAIVSISREHWQRLGPTVADIAGEKAGILKENCPVVVGKLPPEAETVVKSKIAALNCPAVWANPAQKIGENQGRFVPPDTEKFEFNSMEYSLSLLGDIQLMNSAIAIAIVQILRHQGWTIPNAAISDGIAKAQWLGRLQWIQWEDRYILLDGAHNPEAARGLRQYTDQLRKNSSGNKSEITWVMGILATKDWADIFAELLQPGDRLYLVPIPDHQSALPEELAAIARSTCPQLNDCQTFCDLFDALQRASSSDSLIVLCGSLYLVGYFLKQIGNFTH